MHKTLEKGRGKEKGRRNIKRIEKGKKKRREENGRNKRKKKETREVKTEGLSMKNKKLVGFKGGNDSNKEKGVEKGRKRERGVGWGGEQRGGLNEVFRDKENVN